MLLTARGFTFIETLMASIVTAAMAGGTLMSFVLAARIARERNNQQAVEAAGFAVQTVERFRNRVAPDLVAPPPSAQVGVYPVLGDDWLATNVGAGWISDPLPGGAPGDTESMVTIDGVAARRCYRVFSRNCDGVAGNGDCFEVRSHVCWEDLTGCPCP